MDRKEIEKILIRNAKVWSKPYESNQDIAVIYVDDFVNDLLKALNKEQDNCPFYPTMETSSATKCGGCGKEYSEHFNN